MRGPKAAGETRLHPIYVDELRHPNWLFDTVFETECELVPIGVRQRCVPRAAPAIASFSDPACTAALPLARMPAADDRCGGRVPPRFASRDGFVLGLGAPYRGTAYELVDGACIAVTGELHELGEIVPEGSLMISDVIRRDP